MKVIASLLLLCIISLNSTACHKKSSAEKEKEHLEGKLAEMVEEEKKLDNKIKGGENELVPEQDLLKSRISRIQRMLGTSDSEPKKSH
jgi:hypothetical protein